jgi:hypothetical protein
LDWLNGHTVEGIDFFGVELELLKIDDSAPAPHFKLVAQPNEWAKATRETTQTPLTERGSRYMRFFSSILEAFKAERPGLTSGSKVAGDSWYAFTAGRPGFSFVWSFSGGNRFRVELYIDTDDQESTKALFDALHVHADELEASLGVGLAWERLDNRRASRLAIYRAVPLLPPVDENTELRDWALTTMIRWNDALRPVIKQLAPVGPSAGPDSAEP